MTNNGASGAASGGAQPSTGRRSYFIQRRGTQTEFTQRVFNTRFYRG